MPKIHEFLFHSYLSPADFDLPLSSSSASTQHSERYRFEPCQTSTFYQEEEALYIQLLPRSRRKKKKKKGMGVKSQENGSPINKYRLHTKEKEGKVWGVLYTRKRSLPHFYKAKNDTWLLYMELMTETQWEKPKATLFWFGCGFYVISYFTKCLVSISYLLFGYS